MFSGGGFVGAWLPFGEVVLSLFVGLLVQCEGSYSSLDVFSVLVYGVAAPVVFGYPECGPSSGGVALFLSGLFQSYNALVLPGIGVFFAFCLS